MDEETSFSALQLEEERLKLEREALAVERERLAAQRLHAEAEQKLANAKHPMTSFVVVVLLVALAFVGGMIVGGARAEDRIQHQREQRLKEALAQLDGRLSNTNRPAMHHAGGKGQAATSSTTAHRDVAVVVIQ